MRKRITSLLLTLVMLLSLVPAMGVTASAAASGAGTAGDPRVVSTYDEWKAAMQQSSETYIQLGADIDTSGMNGGYGLGTDEWIRVQTDIHLDLNGHKLTLLKSKLNSSDPTYLILVAQGSLTIKDSRSGGEIVGLHQVTNQSMQLIDVMKGAKLTLNSGKLHFEVNADSMEPNATIRFNGTVEINGGTVSILKSSGADERDSYIYTQNFALEAFRRGTSCNAVITGGTLDGRVLLKVVAKDSGVADNVITGGDFKKSIYIQKDKAVTGDVPLNVSIQGGTYHYTSGYYTYTSGGDAGKKRSDPCYNFQFATKGFSEGKNVEYTYFPLEDGTWQDFTADYDMNAFASMFPKNAIISATGQQYEYIDAWFKAVPVKCEDAVYTGSSSALDLARLLNSHYKTITVTTLPEDALTGMKLTVGSDGTELPAEGTSTVSGDVTLGSDGTLTKTVYITALGNKQLKEMYYSNPSKIDFGYRLNIFKNGVPVTDYTGHGLTYAALGDEISVSVQLRDFEFKEGVYTIRLALWPYLRGSEARIGENLVGLWKLTAKEEPPAPVAHSIKIRNTHGTASPTSAMAGETVTVKAKDRTAENMMFTQWYTETAGVTFKDATKQETTFVMPDCDVEVNPGYHGVSFTNQPTDSWLSSVDDSKVYFAFSQPITSWKLVNEDNTTLASGNAESANALVAATLGPKPDKTEMTCRVIVTANGQNFTSNEFTLKWYNVPGAPDVTVYPAGGKFVETLKVNLETPNTYWGILYTTDGSDPYDKSGETWTKGSTAIEENDSTQVPISKDTTIKACLYNSEGYSNMEKFGDIVTCNFTKVAFTPPVADPPSGTSFYDSLNVSLSTDIVNAKIMLSYNDGNVDDLSDPNQWKEYEPEKESITLSGSYGMHGFDAVTGIQMEHPDGYTYWVHSDKQEYLYPRITYATIADASVVGKVNKEITSVDVSITLSGDVFAEDLTEGKDVSSWFTNLPEGLKATVKEKINYTKTLVITISGTPTATSAAAMSVEMPKSALRYTGTGTAVEQTVRPNSKAVYNIVEAGTHTHTYGNWTMLDDSQHSRSCTAGDDVQFGAHTFSAWTKDNETTHSRTCTICKKADGSAYTKTANHNWQWVVVAPATPNAAGKQHEKCVDCPATRSENTEIPMLTSIIVDNLTVAKPVKDATAAKAITTDSTYYVANTEWMTKDGTPLAIGGKFLPGTIYTVKITLETTGAGVFSVKSTYNTIEGKTATVSPDLTGDAHADSVELTYTFDATEGTYVPTKPAITTVTLPDGKVGDAYSQTLAATGTNPITWNVETGDLPDGLTLVGDTIKGTPSKAGEFKFTVKATNGGGFDTKELTIKIADAETAKYHTVTVTSGGNGSASANPAKAVSGTKITLTAKADSGYHFKEWQVVKGGVTLANETSSTTTFIMPAAEVEIKAIFEKNSSTGGGGGGGVTTYPITVKSAKNGDVTASHKSASKGTTVTLTVDPDKGYVLDTLTVLDGNNKDLKLTEKNGKYTFTMPASKVTVEAMFKAAGNNPFIDVPAGSYYEDAVIWAVDKGITTGTSATTFNPNGICTRAQIVTFLWRAAGSPAPKAMSTFVDVSADAYYAKAVAWAVENGITGGTGDGKFSPDAACTRAQAVTFLWRANGSPAVSGNAAFSDVAANAYYAAAVAWAEKNGITGGIGGGLFGSDHNCTRAQIVTFLYSSMK